MATSLRPAPIARCRSGTPPTPRTAPAVWQHSPRSQFRVRHDRIHSGNLALRVDGHIHHIGLGRTLDGTRIIPLIHSYAIRVIHAATGEIIRTLTINPQRRYHGTGKPTGGLCEFARKITTTSSPVVT